MDVAPWRERHKQRNKQGGHQNDEWQLRQAAPIRTAAVAREALLGSRHHFSSTGWWRVLWGSGGGWGSAYF